MKTQTIRKFTSRNLEILFPVILSLGISVYFYRSIQTGFVPTIALAALFFTIGIVGLIFIACQFLTKINIDETGISQLFLGNVKRIQFEEIKTFEIYKIGKFGKTQLNKSDIQSLNLDFKSERIIIISKISNQKPIVWWKKDSNTISIPFQQNIFKSIEDRIAERTV